MASTRTATGFGFALTIVGLVSLTAFPADVVILKDGFVIQGNVRKETDTIFDKTSGQAFTIVKSTGLDFIDEGPKITIFSSNSRQLGGISVDTKIRPEMRGFTTKFLGSDNKPIPSMGETVKATEYNDKWMRELTVKVPGAAPSVIRQQITYMDPYQIRVVSTTHRWTIGYRTSEWDPKLVRKLLMTHPEIAEPDGRCDPLKRISLGRFFLDAGWLQLAKEEVERLQRDHPHELPKDAKEQLEKLVKDIDIHTGELVAKEAELALAAGRYNYTRELLKAFPEKTAGTNEIARIAKVTAELQANQERYDAARRLLRKIVDDATGQHPVNARVALAGGLARATWQPPANVSPELLNLAAAAEQVLTELHPDSALRVEMFVTLAAQVEREQMDHKEPTKKPEELLATAISGWAKGKNGASPDPAKAWTIWLARELILAHQRADNATDRAAIVRQYKHTVGLPAEELARLISLLPPALAEDVEEMSRTRVEIPGQPNTEIYRRVTPTVPGHPGGLPYLVKLPPEYHHGRAYPVLIVLTHVGIKPEDILVPVLTQSDKNGYIVIVPEWTGAFGQGWEWRGEDHVWVTATLRDTVRHFTVDNDKVFLLGVGEGANMAMDIGASHPDLFAGVMAMGPVPKWGGMFIQYWKNAQLLPFFVVTGEFNGEGSKTVRSIYEKWTRYGFPSLWSVYRGRGIEWFAAEIPVFFDWMSRKTRANPVATLKMDNRNRQSWQMIRDTDNRFYWLQADEIRYGTQGGAIVPAEMIGDIRGNNMIDIQHRGVRQFTIWLAPGMVDWSKPIGVRLNGAVPRGYRPQLLEPSVEVLLEDYSARGDRRMLFVNKIVVGP